VASVEQAVEVTGTPASDNFEADVDNCADRSEHVRRERPDVTSFDPRDGRLRYMRQSRDLRLSQPATPPHRTPCQAHSLVVHLRRV
jgi:hypothetical protein